MSTKHSSRMGSASEVAALRSRVNIKPLFHAEIRACWHQEARIVEVGTNDTEAAE